MQPIRDNILIKPLESNSISSGGIIVPESFKKRSSKGEVISVGNGSYNEPMNIKIGSIVHHIKDCGCEIINNGIKYFLIKQKDILAID